MLKWFSVILFCLACVLGCSEEEINLPSVNSDLPDPNGGFVLHVSNQSYAISPVDVTVFIDGKVVVADFFHVGNQHSFTPYKLNLKPGKHNIVITSQKGQTELKKQFDLKDETTGVITYWYYPKSHYNPTPKQFQFRLQKGPLMII